MYSIGKKCARKGFAEWEKFGGKEKKRRRKKPIYILYQCSILGLRFFYPGAKIWFWGV